MLVVYIPELDKSFTYDEHAPRVTSFRGDFAFLSNFYPCDIDVDDETYPSSEHVYMSQKTLDPDLRDAIRRQSTAAKAKHFARTIPLREGWDDIKVWVMYNALQCKFLQNPFLRQLLLATGDAYLEEGNTWKDHFWGVCDGHGLNMLGKLLMLVREELRDGA